MARTADVKRWGRQVVRHLEDFPRQYAALETAMAAFGDDFDLVRFKQAFDTTEDMEAYNRVQAVERALGRVQNFVAELADYLREACLDEEVWGGWPVCPIHRTHPLNAAVGNDGCVNTPCAAVVSRAPDQRGNR